MSLECAWQRRWFQAWMLLSVVMGLAALSSANAQPGRMLSVEGRLFTLETTFDVPDGDDNGPQHMLQAADNMYTLALQPGVPRPGLSGAYVKATFKSSSTKVADGVPHTTLDVVSLTLATEPGEVGARSDVVGQVIDTSAIDIGPSSWVAPNLSILVMIAELCTLKAATSPKEVQRFLTGGGTSLSGFVSSCSLGATRITDTKVVSVSLPCSGVAPNGVPWTARSCSGANPQGWVETAKKQAAETYGIDVTAYNHHVIILPKQLPSLMEASCNWGGISTVGPVTFSPGKPRSYNAGVVWLSGEAATNLPLWFHELGHNLFLMHATSKEPGCEYCDPTSQMGGKDAAGPYMCFNGPQQYQLGWADTLVELDDDGIPEGSFSTFWLPLQGIDIASLLRMHLSRYCETRLYVSLRSNRILNYDQPLEKDKQTALLVHEHAITAFYATRKTFLRGQVRAKGGVWRDTACRIGVSLLSTMDLEYGRVGVCRMTDDAADGREGNCNDGLDNDCDGLTDEEDPDCQKAPNSSGGGGNGGNSGPTPRASPGGNNNGALSRSPPPRPSSLVEEGNVKKAPKPPMRKPPAPKPPAPKRGGGGGGGGRRGLLRG